MTEQFFYGFFAATVFWLFFLLMIVSESFRRIDTLEGCIFRLLKSVRKAYASEEDIKALSSEESYRAYQECSNAVRYRESLK